MTDANAAMTDQNAVQTERKSSTAPAPDDARKPDRMREVTKPSWKYIALKTFREFTKDACPDLAASLTYYAVLSLFPALLALVSVLGVFGQAERTVSGMLDIVNSIAPGSAAETVRGPVEELVRSPAAGLTLVVGILGAVWSASGYVRAFGRAMNRVYEVSEGRGFLRLRGTMLAVTIASVILIAAVSAMLVLSGPVAEAVGNVIGLGGFAVAVWSIAKWPVLLILVMILIASLYYFTPNVKQPKFRWVTVGSVIALLVLAITTAAFGIYVANFGHYNKTYGALGGVIILLLWLWLVNMSLLFGAEFDAETERGRELQAGIGAEQSIQLPPKDTALTEKRKKVAEDDIRRARELRQGRGRPQE